MFDNTTPDDEGPGVPNAEVGAGQNGGPALQGSKPGAAAGRMRRQIMRQPVLVLSSEQMERDEMEE